jgi:signal transduction histidine kinase
VTSSSKTVLWASAFLIGLFQVVGSFGADRNQPGGRPLDTLAIVLLLAGPLALARRDRWPVVAVAVTVAATDIYFWLGYAYGPIIVSLIVAIFAAIQAGRSRATWILAAAGYLVLVAMTLLAPPAGTQTGIGHLAVIPGWLGAVVAISEIVRIRREQAAGRERARVEEQERRVSEQRLHLAQELHDILAHNISLINVQASVALHLLDEQPDQARPALTAIKAASRESLSELRTALDVLRQGDDAPRAPAPRLAELESLLNGVRAGGLQVHFEHPRPIPTLPAAVEQAAYRIVQEALTNITRHARADSATVSVGYENGVDIEVIDDGIGGDAVAGTGITGMRRRAEAMGGTFEAGPEPGGGFRVAAHLPGEPG